ncbi:MAG: 30S ribosomal protein S12 [Candidatus Marsarchaeota archaeon]|nr:30S ribosomal protein S12 [Candidatus Marsarchaeota archaeon]MCL5122468.1 30S ribosomal protein S12 [Candidatus Marsarchaeota archaeon]MCL5431014.1 30S ribosomal protein S12 [Candidatus Marsarchaeota archaeon]
MLKKWLKRKKLKLKQKYDAVGTVPRAKALVLQKFVVEQKQPHSGQIKCVRVQLIKNNRVVGAFVPHDGSINFIDEHDEVTIEGMGGSQRGQMGSIPGMKYKVVEINGASLEEVRTGRKDKPKR